MAFFFNWNFTVKTCPQNAKVWYRSRRCNRILRSYSCNVVKEFITTFGKQDGRIVWYGVLPRHTYAYWLPLLYKLNSRSYDTTDSVILQRILWFPLKSHTTDSVFLVCNQIVNWVYQRWFNTNLSLNWLEPGSQNYYFQRLFKILMGIFASLSISLWCMCLTLLVKCLSNFRAIGKL